MRFWMSPPGALLAVVCAWPLSGLTMDLAQGDALGGRYDLQAYVRLEEDVLLYKDAPDQVSTRSTDLRRARLGLRLRWEEDWIFRAAGNFAHGSSLRDLWLEYRRWPVRIEIGRFPEPFSLGESISSSDTLLISRPSPTILGPDYGFGAGFNYRGASWGLSGGAFTRNAGYTLSGKYPENALDLRGTWRPLAGETGYLHIGASGSVRETQQGSGVQLFGTGESPLASGLGPHSALQPGTDRYRLLGGEMAVRLGSLLMLSEYIRANVMSGGPTWHGEYVEAGWCLTGEKRSYSTRYGTVGGIKPYSPVTAGGFGAWELAARWSATDLRDGGGDWGRVNSVGLNWYPIDLLRISAGAQRAHRELFDGTQRDATLAQLQFQLGF
jgi:phosphate-selective porin OprO and OprP